MKEKYYSYVYRITHIISGYHYYGSRYKSMNARYSSDALEDLKRYQSSSRNKFWKDRIKTHPEEFKFKIVKKFYENRKIGELKALNYEGILHNKFDVVNHPKFINRHNEPILDIEKYVNKVFTLWDDDCNELNFKWDDRQKICNTYNLKMYTLTDMLTNGTGSVGTDSLLYASYEDSIKYNTKYTACNNKGNIIHFKYKEISDIATKYGISTPDMYRLLDGTYSYTSHKLYIDINTYNLWNNKHVLYRRNKHNKILQYKLNKIAINKLEESIYQVVIGNQLVCMGFSKDIENCPPYYKIKKFKPIIIDGKLSIFTYDETGTIYENSYTKEELLESKILYNRINAIWDGKRNRHLNYFIDKQDCINDWEYNYKEHKLACNDIILEKPLNRIEMNKININLYYNLIIKKHKRSYGYTLVD